MPRKKTTPAAKPDATWQEQHTQSIDRYDRDVYRYNVDGQVVHRQSYWKQAGDWQQGDPNNVQAPKPNA